MRTPLRPALTVVLTALAGVTALVQGQLPRAPGAHVVTITPPGLTGSEPAIAVDPSDPNRVVGVAGRWAAYSTDGGRTFTPVQPAGENGRGGGDVSLAFDDKGQLFLSFLSIIRNGLPGYWGHGPGANGIFVRRSPDGGKTWDAEPVAVLEWKGEEPDIKLEDMPRIWADTGARSPHKGSLYMAWIEWQIDKSIVLFSRSADSGKTWSKPMRISTKAGLPRDDNGAVVGIIGTVAPDGTQYIVWNEGLNVTMAVSRDGGRTFEPSRPIFDVGPPYFGGASGIPGVSRAMGFPQVGLDPASGTLYVTWSDFRNGDVDVLISRSADRGRTWTAPMRVNDDPVHSGADQFLQWMAVDPVDGSINVQFYDRRADAANRKTLVTLARSTDGGKTFKNYAWSDEPFAGENAFLGDYEWCTAYKGKVYGIWAEAAPENYTLAPSGRGASSSGRPRTPTIVRVGTADFTADRATRRP
ncbi:MAG TPA: sialidase family protein [Vicinamibacterales bacterium]|nr:sialidase family protein [Vicinamibacterales bacterium]